MSFPVYASIVSFGFFSILLNNCNTRYEWLVRPYSAGTFTLQETPSFAWRTNVELTHQACLQSGLPDQNHVRQQKRRDLSQAKPGLVQRVLCGFLA